MPLPEDTDLQRLRAVSRATVVARVGGYFQNPLHKRGTTCLTCATPVAGSYPLCLPCNEHRRALPAGIADRVGLMTYAVAGQQAGFTMLTYKGQRPNPGAWTAVAVTLAYALAHHRRCAERLAGQPITAWSSVPSLPPKQRLHPLREMIRLLTPDGEAVLTARDTTTPRKLQSDHFSAEPLPRGSHVLLLDDTWVSGGRVQSAAAALRAAGAAEVSALVVARWIRLDWPPSQAFFGDRHVDYDPDVCPWTGAVCPD